MTDGPPHHYPPPGAPPPEDPAPSYPAPAPSYPAPGQPPGPRQPAAPYAPFPPGMLGAAHKPGAIPLRPLTLGNLYDGAFRIIRFNPKATVGAAVLVTAVAMAVPIVVSAVLAFTVGTGLDAGGELADDASTSELLGLFGTFGSFLLALYAAQLGLIFVTGMVSHVTHAAAVGRRLSLGEAWAATRGKRWRLIGLSVLVGLAALLALVVFVLVVVLVAVGTESVGWTVLSVVALGGPLFCLMVVLGIRLAYLSGPALMLEPVGVFGAMRRNWALTRRQFWRTLGIALLTALLTGVASSVVTVPLSILSQVALLIWPESFATTLVVTQALGLIVQNAFVAPFSAAVASLQYLDQRMRKEAYDVELMREAGIIHR